MITKYPSVLIKSLSGSVSAKERDNVPTGRLSNNRIPHCSGFAGVLACQCSCDFSNGRKVRPGSFPSHEGQAALPSFWLTSFATVRHALVGSILRRRRASIFVRVVSNSSLAIVPVMVLLASLAPAPMNGDGGRSQALRWALPSGCCCCCVGDWNSRLESSATGQAA